MPKLMLDALYAKTITREPTGKQLNWTGWTRRHWPAAVIRPGLRVYGFDPLSRKYTCLIKIERGGSFTYRTLAEFARHVRRLTGEPPDRNDPHWRKLPVARAGKHCTGIACAWRITKYLNIPRRGHFPRLGWEQLGPRDADILVDPLRDFSEGNPRLRRHLSYERSRSLRQAAIDYWQNKTGKLNCLGCGFSFEKAYGAYGKGFIEMHHNVPLSARSKRRRNVIDLSPVCSNCHRMIHLDPYNVLTVKELKALLHRRNTGAIK